MGAKDRGLFIGLLASGGEIELPQPIEGRPIAAMDGSAAGREAAARIRRGELYEALIWLERMHPSLVGLVALFERRA